jgi:hypothetical protein
MQITTMKNYAKLEKMKLGKDDIRMCVWVCCKRGKLVLDHNKVILNIDDENEFFLKIFLIDGFARATEIPISFLS